MVLLCVTIVVFDALNEQVSYFTVWLQLQHITCKKCNCICRCHYSILLHGTHIHVATAFFASHVCDVALCSSYLQLFYWNELKLKLGTVFAGQDFLCGKLEQLPNIWHKLLWKIPLQTVQEEVFQTFEWAWSCWVSSLHYIDRSREVHNLRRWSQTLKGHWPVSVMCSVSC